MMRRHDLTKAVEDSACYLLRHWNTCVQPASADGEGLEERTPGTRMRSDSSDEVDEVDEVEKERDDIHHFKIKLAENHLLQKSDNES